jgi:hypothetical protein
MILTGENQRTRRKTFSGSTFSTTNPTFNALETNLDLLGTKPAIIRMCYDTANYNSLTFSDFDQDEILRNGKMSIRLLRRMEHVS